MYRLGSNDLCVEIYEVEQHKITVGEKIIWCKSHKSHTLIIKTPARVVLLTLDQNATGIGKRKRDFGSDKIKGVVPTVLTTHMKARSKIIWKGYIFWTKYVTCFLQSPCFSILVIDSHTKRCYFRLGLTVPILKVLDSHSATAMIEFNTCSRRDHNKYIQHRHIPYAINKLHKNEKIKKRTGKGAVQITKSFQGLCSSFKGYSKTMCKKPGHTVCFNPKSKQCRAPHPHMA